MKEMPLNPTPVGVGHTAFQHTNLCDFYWCHFLVDTGPGQ